MKILFTGATGVLGTAAIPHLIEAGHEVVGVGRTDLDLFDRAAVGRAVAGCDAVFHFATAMPAQAEMTKREAWRINDRLREEATANLVDAAIEQRVSTFVQESVAFAYADGGAGWLDEAVPLDPPFGAIDSAMVAEAHVARFTAQGGRGIVLRLGRLYGPGPVSGPYLEAVSARKLPLIGRGDNYVSHLHIDDAGAAVAAALDAPAGAYNVVEDEPVTAAEEMDVLVETLGARHPRRVPAWLARRLVGPATGLMTVSHRVSNGRFREAAGWSPEYSSVCEGWPAIVADDRRARMQV
ncbi:MAG TPA: NAD(P)-dependent oxidoreductase [Acidimicrobiia bacterium]|nr:NAD(P)-dependent oxidoreductase [Acidimicrobiia bacterium]